MSREIKFRAWDNTTSNPKMIFWDYLKKAKYEDVFILSNDVILMQFTGLKDKNGKEIYEGDICIVPYFKDTSRGVIEYRQGAFIFQSKEDPSKQVVGWSLIKEIETEVIGNIYENTNLLK